MSMSEPFLPVEPTADPDLPAGPLGYGVGVWREQLTPAGALRHASSLGAYGFSPWVDVERRLGGALVVLDDGPDVVPTYLEMKRRIAAALGEAPTAGDAAPGAADGAAIDVPWPHPVRRRSRLAFRLPEATVVRLELTDVRGRAVAVLAEGAFAAGTHTDVLDARRLAAGVYVAVLRVDGRVAATRRVTVR